MFKIKRVWVLGFVAVFLLVLSFYAEFVHLASCMLRCDFVEAISLSSKFDSAEVSRFGMGEDVVLMAKVWGSNFYFLDVYDENGTLVFSENGAVNSSIVETYIPLLPPAFTAKETYSVVFQSGLVNYPLLGVCALSSSLSGFEVINSSTKLSFMAKYDEATNELQAWAFLSTINSSPVANKTVSFFVKPDKDLPMRDRGWVYLGSEDTDENGSVLFSVAVNMMSGCHEVEARFAGDDNFGSSKNSTSFQVSPKTVKVRIVSADRKKDRISLLLRVTDKYNFPLAGKLLSFEALNTRKSILRLISNATGYMLVSLDLDRG